VGALLGANLDNPQCVSHEGTGSDNLRLAVLKEPHGCVRGDDAEVFTGIVVHEFERAGAASVGFRHRTLQSSANIDFRVVPHVVVGGWASIVINRSSGADERDDAKSNGLDDDKVSYG
jgi:hypothetical protein